MSKARHAGAANMAPLAAFSRAQPHLGILHAHLGRVHDDPLESALVDALLGRVSAPVALARIALQGVPLDALGPTFDDMAERLERLRDAHALRTPHLEPLCQELATTGRNAGDDEDP